MYFQLLFAAVTIKYRISCRSATGTNCQGLKMPSFRHLSACGLVAFLLFIHVSELNATLRPPVLLRQREDSPQLAELALEMCVSPAFSPLPFFFPLTCSQFFCF